MIVCNVSLHAQITSEGRDFYLGFLNPSYNTIVAPLSAGFFRVYAYVSSYQNNVVTFSYFNQQTGKEEVSGSYQIQAGRTVQILLDFPRMQMTEPGDVAGEFRSCRVTAQKPVTVQFFSTGACAGGSYLALPVNAWGRQYVVASYRDNVGEGGLVGGRGPSKLGKSAGVFLIIAAYDGTTVTIIPTAQTGGGHVGVNQGPGANGTPKPYSINLRRGECWMVKSQSAERDESDDISASIVKSNKPVAVIAGHENAFTEGSESGGYSAEQRDYMIEQMVPVEYWDNEGYISIPFLDSPGNNGLAAGDHLRLYVYDELVPSSVRVQRAATIDSRFPVTYGAPEQVLFSMEPVHFSADSSKKFSVVQYDIRNQGTPGTAMPIPTPNMMSLVPRSQWRNAYVWFVPIKSAREAIESHYITVIAPASKWDSILVSANGTNIFSKLSSIGGSKKVWTTIPGHPDLRAVTYNVTPNTSYYAKANFPFLIYQFGCRAFADYVVGNFDGDDHFISYANPLGMALRKDVPSRTKVSVDSLCTGWKVCASAFEAGGIQTIAFLDDPNGNFNAGKSYQYKNVRFDPLADPLNLREITKYPPESEWCFNVHIENPGADASAPVYIIDANGVGAVIELTYKAQAVTFIPPDSVGLFFTTGEPPRDTSEIYPPYVHEEVCKEYVFVNKAQSSRSYNINRLEVPSPSNFKVISSSPGIGEAVDPGDSLKITICFIGPDTNLYLDSIELETDCFKVFLPLRGQAATPLIVAADRNFGSVLIGSKKCMDVEVRNDGAKPFTLDKNWMLTPGEFSFDTSLTKNILPRTLLPGQSHKFSFCYSPSDEGSDTALQAWSTNIPEPYRDLLKSFSELRGTSVGPGVRWDRTTQEFRADSLAEFVARVNLLCSGTTDAELTGIWIDGPDADEFRIVNTEFGVNPPSYRGTVMSIEDEMWVDVGFKLDMTRTPLDRLHSAFLHTAVAGDSARVKTMALTAGFDLAHVSEQGIRNVVISPNPARDRIYIDLDLETSTEVSVAIYDLLGREVLMQTHGNRSGRQQIVVSLPSLAPGIYFARVKMEGAIKTLPFEVRK